MSSSKPTLTYFNGKGRAEIARYIFAVAGVDYVDQRFEQEQWATVKPTFGAPFGQLPVLEIDGVKLCQSNAFSRYIARKYHLAGKTDLEQAQADMLVDCFEDASKPMITFWYEKDTTKQAELQKKYNEEQLPGYLASLEALLKQNHGGDCYLVGTDLTWADLVLINFAGWTVLAGNADAFANFPKLKALKEKVEKHPKIAEWIAKRPKTDR